MKPERWRAAEEIFHLAGELAPAQRAAFLAQRCPDDPELRGAVEQLLASEPNPPRKAIADAVRSAAVLWADAHAGSLIGRRIGPYLVTEVIGEGGMGSVYRAVRDDDAFRQEVALKLIKRGMDSQSIVLRFRNERQILATLEHPNIARLLDGGTTDGGLPYFVMECVRGRPITDYCAENKLDTRERLGLFRTVCSAVQHAHGNLVVHRDLKPSNMLVTDEGAVKLLDFGIAKVLASEGGPNPTLTLADTRVFTPDYGSPEQVRGEPVSTATDVYALGVVLYELLSGNRPHNLVTHSASEAGKRLDPALPTDIDHILRKALREEPKERYASADALADDLQAFLESRPVRARSGNAWYRTRKFVRRYWLPVTAAALVIASLSSGLFVANRERATAQRRFQEVRQLSNKLFDIDRQVLGLPGSAKARQLIVDTSLDYLRRLAKDAPRDPDLALDVGTAYMRVGRVQGVPISANLGQAENAEQNLRIAEGLIHSVLATQPANRTAMLRAAQIAHDRMILAQARRPDTEALPLARQSDHWLGKYLGTGNVDEVEANQVIITGVNIANWYMRKDLVDAGLPLLRRAIDLAKATNQPEQASAAYIVMARGLRSMGDLDGALAAIREGVSLLEFPLGGKIGGWANRFGLALVTQGEILGEDDAISLGQREEAAEYFERGFRLAADWVRQDPNDALSRFAVSTRGIRLAGVLRHSDARRALVIYDEVLSRMAEVKSNPRARRDEIRALAGSTYPLRRIGHSAEARARLDAAFSRLSELKLYPAEQVLPGSEPDNALRALAEYEAGTGNVRRGIETYQQLLGRIMASKPTPESRLADATDLSNLYGAMAVLHRRARQAELASALAARRLELWRHWDRKLPNNTFVHRQLEAATVQ